MNSADAARQSVPVYLNGHLFGKVAQERKHRLQQLSWDAMRFEDGCVHLVMSNATADLAALHDRLRQSGLISGWRDETVEAVDSHGTQVLGHMERAAARFWGSLTRAVHLNGWVRSGQTGHVHLWFAQRALSKATDPGLWDNLVAGGVAAGESPRVTLLREAQEECGLNLDDALEIREAPPVFVEREVPQGWQREHLHVLDAQLAPDWHPHNHDGEVQAFVCLDLPSAHALATSDRMAVDAALVTSSFLARAAEPGGAG